MLSPGKIRVKCKLNFIGFLLILNFSRSSRVENNAFDSISQTEREMN